VLTPVLPTHAYFPMQNEVVDEVQVPNADNPVMRVSPRYDVPDSCHYVCPSHTDQGACPLLLADSELLAFGIQPHQCSMSEGLEAPLRA